MSLPWLSLTLLGIGCVVSVICGILVLVVAFQKHPLWLFGCLFIPFCSLVFLVMHWHDVKSAFFGQLLGLAIIVAGIATTPEFNAAFWKGYNTAAARGGGKPVLDELSAEIQKHRDQLDSLQGTFARDGAELTKEYQALDAHRKALKSGDTEAITKFNEAAAAYQAKNAARKQMQAQIDSTQKELESLLDTRARHAPTATTATTTSSPSNKRVVMYGTNHCPACAMARQYFAKNGVRYEEINVEGNRTAYEEFRRLGGTGVPLILIGDQKFEGFNSHALDVALR